MSTTIASGNPNSGKVFTYFTDDEAYLDELLSADKLNFTEVESLIFRVSMLMHHSEKKFTKELSHSYEQAREARINDTIGTMRGRTIAALALTTGTLHMIAGMGNLAPSAMFAGTQKFSDAASKITGGRAQPFSEFLKRFDVSKEEHVSQIGRVFGETFSGFAKATEGVQSIAHDRRQSYQTEHHSKAENYLKKKEEINQEVQQVGSRVDDCRRQASERANKKMEMVLTILRV